MPNKDKDKDKDELLKRLKKIEGQVKGIQRMITEDKYCVDVLVQIAAVKAAINKVGAMVFERHTKTCLRQVLLGKEPEDQIDELIQVLVRYSK